jgi:hypothetical protein
MILYYIFINCNWVVTRWQYTFTHKQYIEQQNNNRTTQITTNVEECGPCPVFASFTLAFALQLRKKARKNLSQGKKNLSQVKKNLRVQYTYYQNTHTLQTPHI